MALKLCQCEESRTAYVLSNGRLSGCLGGGMHLGKGQNGLSNLQRKLKAAVAWCERINQLDAEHRGGLPWHDVLLAEVTVYEWQGKGAHLADLLDFSRLRPLADASLQERLI